MTKLDILRQAPRAPDRAAGPKDGALNLLSNCAGVQAGDRLLLVVEPPGLGQYDEQIGPFIAEQARALGATVAIMAVPVGQGPEDVPPDLWPAIGAVDHTIFLSRVGDQVRFTRLPGPGSKTMVHTLSMSALAAPFGYLPYGFLVAAHDRLVDRLNLAKSITVRCAAGTDLTVTLSPQDNAGGSNAQDLAAFTLKTFPVMITPTIPARTLTGKLAASLALTAPAVHDYDDPVLPLPAPVIFCLEQGRIVGFEGDEATIAKVKAHLQRIADLVGGDPWAINSLHTGINPTVFFDNPALSDLERWTAVTFGSPRYTHFHMCGNDPGEISAKIFDPTIAIDGEVIWRDGELVYLDRPDLRALAAEFDVPQALLRLRGSIGI
jgi:hypothetical protein